MSGMWPGLGPKKIRWGAPGRRTWLHVAKPNSPSPSRSRSRRSSELPLSVVEAGVTCGLWRLWPVASGHFFYLGSSRAPAGEVRAMRNSVYQCQSVGFA